MKPWGHIDWLLKWYADRSWKLISSVGFEPRSTALIEHAAKHNIPLDSALVLRIDDPPSEFTSRINDRTEANRTILRKCVSGIQEVRADLMEPAETWKSLVDSVCAKPDASVLLDVSTLPKRVGLFLLRQLVLNESVRDIVVCYVSAEGYREGHLVQDEYPPLPLPGFGLTSSVSRDNAFFVSVGYSAFDLRQVLQQRTSPNIHFIMPFPPASPSFRRTWKFLKILNEKLELADPYIERFSSVDMFAVYEWLDGPFRSKQAYKPCSRLGQNRIALRWHWHRFETRLAPKLCTRNLGAITPTTLSGFK